MKLEIGDKVRTGFGNGEIVFITEGKSFLHYLVKIKGVGGHDGNGVYGYVNKDGLNDKRWFLEKHLELLKKED